MNLLQHGEAHSAIALWFGLKCTQIIADHGSLEMGPFLIDQIKVIKHVRQRNRASGASGQFFLDHLLSAAETIKAAPSIQP